MPDTGMTRAGLLALLGTAALAPLPAAAQTVTLPQSDTTTYNGAALTITNNATSTATRYAAIKGNATGGMATGVLGQASGAKGAGVLGTNSDTGFGGLFNLTGKTTKTDSAALEARHSGGPTGTIGPYGQAGNFAISNSYNSDNALSAVSMGPGNGGYFAVNSANGADNTTGRGNIPLPGNPNSAAIWAENDNSNGGTCSTIGAPCWGEAGYFAITNPGNQSDALFAETPAPHGTAVHGYVGPVYPTAVLSFISALGVYGEDLTYGVPAGQTPNGAAVLGASGAGFAAYFTGGADGPGNCYYRGGASWSCSAPAAAMKHVSAPDYGELLNKLEALPINYYELDKAGHPSRNLGPSAEDFRAAFNLGNDDPKVISDGDVRGVALAAAKGLYVKLKADEAEIAALKRQLAEQKAVIASLGSVKDSLAALQTTVRRLSHAAPVQQASLPVR